MDFSDYFPIWPRLTAEERESLSQASRRRKLKKGGVLYDGSSDCLGLVLLERGQLRAYILSEGGREVTIYRLFERDICLFSAACLLSGLRFAITIEAEKDSELWIIDAAVYKKLMERSVLLANYTNEIMASRVSELFWLIEQIMGKSLDRRLAAFLLQEADLEGSSLLTITHEKIAGHLGTAREVITRILRYFQAEGLVKVRRGLIEITDGPRLAQIGSKTKPPEP